MKKKFKKILWIIPISLVVLFLLMLFSFYSGPMQVVKYDMYLEVSGGTDDMCISGDTDALYFGKVPPTAQSKRDIVIKNLPEVSKVVIEVDGPLSSWTHINKNDFILQPGELTNVTVKLTVPFGAQPGDYTGTFKVKFYKPVL